tara:strand:+ start:202 stop:549 length:348 start_codon:yes stop_codon:yes gene_type:complete
MIKIHQIQLTEAQIDLINAEGHDAVPAQKAKLAVAFFGAEKFKAEDFAFYSEAFQVHTDNMDLAFEYTNLWNNQYFVEVIGDRNHSTSVGDILEMDNGDFFMIDPCGFTQIEVAA